MARTKKVPFASWETDKTNGIEKRYIRLGNSQMLSAAMRDLKPLAFKLYTYMRLESGGAKIFEFPYSKFKYISSKQGFQNSVQELVIKGFIDIKEKNANLRTPNKYEFSDRWKNYGDKWFERIN